MKRRTKPRQLPNQRCLFCFNANLVPTLFLAKHASQRLPVF